MSIGSSKPSSKISRSSARCLRRSKPIRKPGTIVTTNTSGLPVAKIAEGFSDDFRRSWFGTHFFNPPRYMRLLELIPTPEADPRTDRSRRSFRRHATRQRRRAGKRHSQLHRQPYRNLFRAQRDPPHAGNGHEHRGCGRAHRAKPSAGRAPPRSARLTWSASTFWDMWFPT